MYKITIEYSKNKGEDKKLTLQYTDKATVENVKKQIMRKEDLFLNLPIDLVKRIFINKSRIYNVCIEGNEPKMPEPFPCVET